MSRIFRNACLGLSLALMAGPVGAQRGDEKPPPSASWEGVWQGSVGRLPVHVCLDSTSFGTNGVYYYDRHMQLLRLKPGAADGEWLERDDSEKDGAKWKLTGDESHLRGTWDDGKEDLPVRLKRLGGLENGIEGPCASMAFHLPRIASAQPTSKQLVKDGEPYTSWTFKPGPWLKEVESRTFTLDRPGPQITRINALLRASLPNSDGTGEWLNCVAASVNATGRDGSYVRTIEPGLMGKRWLAVTDNGGYYCGGAHPNSISRPRTFDLVEGREVDPLDWFGPEAVDRKGLGGGRIVKKLTPQFIKMLLNDRQFDNPECGLATEDQKYWSVGIGPGALVFAPQFPHPIVACTEDYEVSLARLQPWLNEAGKAAFASLPR